MTIQYPRPRKMFCMFISYVLKAFICLFWIIPFSINFISKIKEINGIVNFKQGMEIFFSPFKNMTQSALIFIGALSFCFFFLNLISRSNKASLVYEDPHHSSARKLIPSILILSANLLIMFSPILLSAFAPSLFFASETSIILCSLIPLIYLSGSLIFDTDLHKYFKGISHDIQDSNTNGFFEKSMKIVLMPITMTFSFLVGLLTFIFNIHNNLINTFFNSIDPLVVNYEIYKVPTIHKILNIAEVPFDWIANEIA